MAKIINDQPPPPPPPPPTNPPAPFNAKDFVVQKGYMLDSMSKPSGFVLLCFYTTPSSIPYITVADGSHACVVGTGNIDLQPPFQLQSVLCDLTTGHTIGIAKEKEGLYYFSDDHPKVLSSCFQSQSSSSAS
ncbi:hypothetical protein KIW84_032631 [Lathyrus oleraceus]|uniref:Uncharacterized protein n=1 Tax=Pisum sativum TaxID=3888 RepID=A0A9D4XUE9_PEA|nr:hypothetical protein KIW84_032631 [Pisum sativum]